MVDTRRSFFVSKLITRRRWGFKSFGYQYLVETPWFFKRVFVFLSQFALLSFPTCSPFHITDYHSKPHDYLSFHLSLFFHRWPKLCESSLDFEFIRGGRQGMGWGFDCLCWTWGRAFNQFFFFPGEGIYESFFARHGTDVGMDLTADSDERDWDRTYVSPLPRFTHATYGLEISGNHGSQREQAKGE